MQSIFKGIRPAVVALIAAPTFKMGKSAKIGMTNVWIPVVSALLIWLLGVSPIYIIIMPVWEVTCTAVMSNRRKVNDKDMWWLYIKLFYSFFKIGLFGFGGGYAMISLIQGEVVNRYHWLTSGQFTDIVAISQMTPGPIGINSATYVAIPVWSMPVTGMVGRYWVV